ncbi:sugar dehydrogenase complex small subunit [Aquibaculum arenosum]|uniref:Sugar dehydrogenase complex small subunit n=1 Tax=Aquibaculum arenosum TaxID=3032591 RepID=A0ABT5YJ99_9PROT|nr:sugar dehydrogenase complex small subunit [Fodinicurvata sp. CAU 1616]MDF2094962.1 sugar dehydrogenase complex small subunit [Fodinicurvata sp. CAU 1616]
MTARTTRRSLLLSALASAIAAAGASGFPARLYAGAGITESQFFELSQTLTGTKNLNPRVARTLLGSFLAMGKGAELEALAAEMPSPDGTGEVAETLIAAWYSGILIGPEGPLATDYTGALLWNALAFTKPAGLCGGETNYWSEPPESQR